MLIPLPLVFTSDNVELYKGSGVAFDQNSTLPTIFLSPTLISHFSIPTLQPIILKSTLQYNAQSDADMDSGDGMRGYITPVQVYPEPQLDEQEVLFSTHLYNFTKISAKNFTRNIFAQKNTKNVSFIPTTNHSNTVSFHGVEVDDCIMSYQLLVVATESAKLNLREDSLSEQKNELSKEIFSQSRRMYQKSYSHLANHHQSLVRKGNLPFIHASVLQLAPCINNICRDIEWNGGSGRLWTQNKGKNGQNDEHEQNYPNYRKNGQNSILDVNMSTYQLQQVRELLLIKYAHTPMFLPTLAQMVKEDGGNSGQNEEKGEKGEKDEIGDVKSNSDNLKLILFLDYNGQLLTYEATDALFMLDNEQKTMVSISGAPFVIYTRAQNLSKINIVPKPPHNPQNGQKNEKSDPSPQNFQNVLNSQNILIHSQKHHDSGVIPASEGLLAASKETSPLPLYSSMQSIVASALIQSPIDVVENVPNGRNDQNNQETIKNGNDQDDENCEKDQSSVINGQNGLKSTTTKFSLIGPKGTGKSTTLYNALSTLARFQQGNLAGMGANGTHSDDSMNEGCNTSGVNRNYNLITNSNITPNNANIMTNSKVKPSWSSIPLYIKITTIDLFSLISSTSTKFDSASDIVIHSDGSGQIGPNGTQIGQKGDQKLPQLRLINSLFSTWLNNIITIINNSSANSSYDGHHHHPTDAIIELTPNRTQTSSKTTKNTHFASKTPHMTQKGSTTSKTPQNRPKKSLFLHFCDLDYYLRDEDHIPYSFSSDGAADGPDADLRAGEAVKGVLHLFGEFLTSLSYLFSSYNLFIVIESNHPDVLPDVSMPFIQIGSNDERGRGQSSHLRGQKGQNGQNNVPNVPNSDFPTPSTQIPQQPHKIQQYTIPIGIPTRTEANLSLLSLYTKMYQSVNDDFGFDLSVFPTPHPLISSSQQSVDPQSLIPPPQQDPNVSPPPLTSISQSSPLSPTLSFPSSQELWLLQLLSLQKASNVPVEKFIVLLRKYKHFLPSWLNTLLVPSNSPAVMDFLFNSFFEGGDIDDINSSIINDSDNNISNNNVNNTINATPNSPQPTSPDHNWSQAIFDRLFKLMSTKPGLVTTVTNLASSTTTTSLQQLQALIQSTLMAMSLVELRKATEAVWNGSVDGSTSMNDNTCDDNNNKNNNYINNNNSNNSTKSPSLPPRYIGNQPLVAKFNGIIQQWQTLLNLGPEMAGAMHGIGGNIMLYGPHGNGKSLLIETLVAQQQQGSSNGSATAHNNNTNNNSTNNNPFNPSPQPTPLPSTKLNIIYLNPSDVFSKWLGESEKKIRQTFALARQSSPSLIIIDHIDSIASNRNSNSTHNAGVDLRILSTLLNELDGLDGENGGQDGGKLMKSLSKGSKPLVFVIATCSDLNNIDPALLRSGRFDHVVNVPGPSREGVREMVYGELRQVLLREEIEKLYPNTNNTTPLDTGSEANIPSATHIPNLPSPNPSNDLLESIIDEMVELGLSSGTVLQLIREVVRGAVYE